MPHPESTAAPQPIDAGPTPIGLATHLYPPVPFTTPPTEISAAALAMIEKLAPIFSAAFESLRRPGPSRAEQRSEDRDSRGSVLLATTQSIAHLAHAFADLKEMKSASESTSAIQMAITRLSTACVPVKDAPTDDDDLDDHDRATICGALHTMSDALSKGELDIERSPEDTAAIGARMLLERLSERWGMVPTPAEERAGG